MTTLYTLIKVMQKEATSVDLLEAFACLKQELNHVVKGTITKKTATVKILIFSPKIFFFWLYNEKYYGLKIVKVQF